jgi:hypothetical protein
MNVGPATSAGPKYHSAIAGIIRKVRFDCIDPAQAAAIRGIAKAMQ